MRPISSEAAAFFSASSAPPSSLMSPKTSNCGCMIWSWPSRSASTLPYSASICPGWKRSCKYAALNHRHFSRLRPCPTVSWKMGMRREQNTPEARIQAILIAERKVVQQVVHGLNTFGRKHFGQARANAFYELDWSRRFQHQSDVSRSEARVGNRLQACLSRLSFVSGHAFRHAVEVWMESALRRWGAGKST